MRSAIRWHVFENAAAVSRGAAEHILAAAGSAIGERGAFHIVLAGGRTPVETYRILSGSEANWIRWHIYFGDERCLPRSHQERNSTAASRAWLDRVQIPAANIHIIPAELGADQAADAYKPVVREALPFDLVLLGLGEDGHTASLFPGCHPSADLAVPVRGAPKPPPDRVSLTALALSSSREILVLVTGATKRGAVQAWRLGEDLPIASVKGHNGVDVLIDRDADAA